MRSKSSFTLVEVLAALLIMAIAFSAIAQGQGGAIRGMLRAESLSRAVALAQDQMTELELALRKRNFEAFAETDEEAYDEEGLEGFKFKQTLEKVDLGCFIPTDDEENAQAGLVQLAEGIFEKAIRKAIIEVEWEEGNQTRNARLVQLLVRFEEMPQL